MGEGEGGQEDRKAGVSQNHRGRSVTQALPSLSCCAGHQARTGSGVAQDHTPSRRKRPTLSAGLPGAEGVLAAALHGTSCWRRRAKRKPRAEWGVGRGEAGGREKGRKRASARRRRERKGCGRKGHGLSKRMKKRNCKYKPQEQTFRTS